ncbi:uncharacterized protein An08g07850 [Aspergillus niger]|uniref:Contig An08c0210, genomic contig n=2 Tax=Aspergillus niger TaxID=5061 RepID=A2QS06_ASPNC|nr:uncharacterized protein An08g07850 [Aspergillus niger]CAK45678.1 unnamed protein product [Aspergillus niger]
MASLKGWSGGLNGVERREKERRCDHRSRGRNRDKVAASPKPKDKTEERMTLWGDGGLFARSLGFGEADPVRVSDTELLSTPMTCPSVYSDLLRSYQISRVKKSGCRRVSNNNNNNNNNVSCDSNLPRKRRDDYV